MARAITRFSAALVCALGAAAASAADFRSVGEAGAVMYDAPSVKAKKLYVVSADYPVEVIVNDGPWVKVRDASGELSWLERKSLADRRIVMVTAPVAEVRASPADQAPVVFRAQQGVALQLAEIGSNGWARVRHRDGRSGYVRIGQVWGL